MDILYMIWPEPDLAAIAHIFDTSGPEARLHTVVDLGRCEMAHLFEAAAENPPTTLDDFVPPDCPTVAEVIHYGKNSLPVLTRFEKRFRRPPLREKELWGYHRHELGLVTGPGYFAAHPDDGRPGVVLDYTHPPSQTLPGWPRADASAERMSRIVYGGRTDVMRRLSRHVTVGRVARYGRARDAWYFLVRDDRPKVVARARPEDR